MIKFDKEYSTNFLQEFRYLESNNVKPSFVKDINGLRTFKYTKTKELFELLTKFYSEK